MIDPIVLLPFSTNVLENNKGNITAIFVQGFKKEREDDILVIDIDENDNTDQSSMFRIEE